MNHQSKVLPNNIKEANDTRERHSPLDFDDRQDDIYVASFFHHLSSNEGNMSTNSRSNYGKDGAGNDRSIAQNNQSVSKLDATQLSDKVAADVSSLFEQVVIGLSAPTQLKDIKFSVEFSNSRIVDVHAEELPGYWSIQLKTQDYELRKQLRKGRRKAEDDLRRDLGKRAKIDVG